MKKDPRELEGAIVHTLAKWALGEHTAKNILGKVDYNKTFFQGTAVNVFDGRKTNGKNATWVLMVDFMLPFDDSMAVVKLKRAEIHRQHCIPRPVTAGKNVGVIALFIALWQSLTSRSGSSVVTQRSLATLPTSPCPGVSGTRKGHPVRGLCRATWTSRTRCHSMPSFI